MNKRKKPAKGLTSSSECPRCGGRQLRSWAELDDEQRFLAERLPGSADYSPEERKKHRYCTRCWFEETEQCVEVA